MKIGRLKSLCLITLLSSALTLVASPAQSHPATSRPKPANAQRLAWWRSARFGLFIHWGPVSLTGHEISWSRGVQTPIAVYDHLYQHFDPTNFNADAWARIAKAAGMKYVVFTTKHHDGFCMWNTKQTDYNIMHTPFHRDVVKELAAACRRHGLAFGTYYSVADWHNPDFPLTSPDGHVRRPTSNLNRYERYLKAQVAELIHNYGPLLVMWFDVPEEFDRRRGQALVDYVRSLQPDILINNRSGAPGDYDTPEQRIGKFQYGRPWETCMTLCTQWSWKPHDTMKSLRQCVQTLVLCAGGDGNLLLNVGPMPDGRIEPRQAKRLEEIGKWLTKFGQSIYATRGGPWKPNRALASTRRGHTIFVHILRWQSNSVTLPNLPRHVLSGTLLTGGRVTVTQQTNGIVLTVPPQDHRAIDTIVKLKLDGSAMDLAPVAIPSSIHATASDVYQHDDDYAADKAFDGDPSTRWATDAGTHQAWVERNFTHPRRCNVVHVSEAYPGRVQQFELQYKNGGAWQTLVHGTTLGAHYTHHFPPVTLRAVRLNILQATEGPTISEIALSWVKTKIR